MDLSNDKLFEIIGSIVKIGFEPVSYKLIPDPQRYISHSNEFDVILLPQIAFWDPLVCEKHYLICPHCFEDDGSSSYLTRLNIWECGQTSSKTPRLIWDVTWRCALVGHIYTCQNRHQIVSYHAGVLKQIRPDEVPFMLTHRSGMTKQVFDFLFRMLEGGNNFTAIETVFRCNVVDNVCRKLARFDIGKVEEIVEVMKKLSPSRMMFQRCLVHNFLVYYEGYKVEFDKIPFEILCGDHTFRVAANIGFYKNGKWITQYDCVFILINEKGHVKGFKFSKGTGFDRVHDLLSNVAKQPFKAKLFCIDNCCHWKEKIFQIFPECQVKLDLFHAVKRLTSALSKKHPLFYDACKEIGLIFREEGDVASIRKKDTPLISKINKNLDLFLSKWTSMEVKGWKLLNSNFFKEIEKLKKHINIGCLSSIPPGIGTNRNESLHSTLKYLVVRGKLSILTAEALFTHIFYCYNAKLDGKCYPLPIWFYHKPTAAAHLRSIQKRSCSQTNEDDDLYAYMVQENGPESDHIYNKPYFGKFSNF